MLRAFTSVHQIYSTPACLSVISVIITRNLNAPCIHISSSHLLYARLLVSHLCHYNTSVHHIYSTLAFLSVISVIITCNLNVPCIHISSSHLLWTRLSVISVIITRNLTAPCIHVSSSHLLYTCLLVSHLCHYNTQSQCSVHSRQFITSTLHSLACQSSLSL